MQELPKLWDHQIRAVEKARGKESFAFFMDIGTGKTRTLIEVLREKFNAEKRVLKTLILCPPIVVPNWKNEWFKYSKIARDQVCTLQGHRDQRIKTFRNTLAQIVITNYESLMMDMLFRELLEWEPDILVCDEIHYLKSKAAKRTKRALTLSKVAKFRYGLSGTPVLNSPMDLWSQYMILDHGKTFGENYFAFRAKHFVDKNAGMPRQRYFPNFKIRDGALSAINEALSENSITAKKDEVLDLPEFVEESRFVEMTSDQERHYRQMKNAFITYLTEEKVSVAKIALTKALRLLQITSGFLKLDTGEEFSYRDNPKISALRELLEELTPNHKVLVWACFKENYRQIAALCDELKIKYVEVHGGVTTAQRQKAVEALNTDPEVRVFIGHPASGGIGINLVAASYSIFYSQDFSLGNDIQAEGRNYRGGSEIHSKITRINLVCSNSIDEVVNSDLDRKEKTSEQILRQVIAKLREEPND